MSDDKVRADFEALNPDHRHPVDEQGNYLYAWHNLAWKAYQAGRKAGMEEAAVLLENGRFLHDEAPTARLAREAAQAIREAVK